MLPFVLTIGRFADATGLTVKALRHYDDIGLLVPAHVDPQNGYRHYTEDQIVDAVTIRKLRAIATKALQQLGRALDVSEQEGDGPARELACWRHGWRRARPTALTLLGDVSFSTAVDTTPVRIVLSAAESRFCIDASRTGGLCR